MTEGIQLAAIAAGGCMSCIACACTLLVAQAVIVMRFLQGRRRAGTKCGALQLLCVSSRSQLGYLPVVM